MSITRRQFLQATASAGAIGASDLSAAAETSSIFDDGWRPRRLDRKPNIAIVVLDDTGFADLGCYGSEHRTPCIDGLAAGGARFNNFHVTALCAPTRACLLTGRNAHAVGVGNIAEWGRDDHPGYRGWIRQDAMTFAEILKPAGYSTMATGKWHLSTLADQNGTGPFDHWPVRRGFDRWYGFHGNAMDHWHPEMFENTSAAYPDKTDGYHLSADLVDRSIHYVEDHLAATPDQPFFLYLAFGAMHFPLHCPLEFQRGYRGRYDGGWDEIRQERFERQLELGIVPRGTELAPRNPDVPAWSELTDSQRRLAARGQENYAGFLEHTDAQLKRLIDFLAGEGQLDNTIVMVLSDNGAAPGGPIEGTLDARRDAYLGSAPIEEFLADIDLIGTDASYCGYSRGWAQASNTPLKWYKSDTYEGGIRAPLIVHWPRGGLPAGSVNGQYHHVIDVVPTLLNMIEETVPSEFRGGEPLPIQGTSFAYSFDDTTAQTRKTVQYFETLGDRAIWSHGWKAVARHTPGSAYEDDVWELFHAAQDFSEITNLAKQHPDRLAELTALWRAEAERYNVLPLEDDTLKLYQNSVPAPRATYVFYPGMTRLDRLSAPDIYSYDSRLSADLVLSARPANGVILASGDSSCGYELFMQDGILTFAYVYTRHEIYSFRAATAATSGSHTIGLQIAKTGEYSADVQMFIDDVGVGRLTLPKMWPIYAPNSGIRCGENRHSPISRAYEPPFVFDQDLKRVVVDVDMS